MRLRRGFKTEAEWYAEDLRRDLGLSRVAPIPMAETAKLLGVSIFKFSEFVDSVAMHSELNKVSAICYHAHGHCAAIVNDSHSENRIRSSLCHEFAHLLLCHKAEIITASEGGCRNFDAEKESEANWLAGSILIPNVVARRIVFSDKPEAEFARHYGVSLEMLRFRLRVSGAYKMQKAKWR